jgi:hypothetical protein
MKHITYTLVLLFITANLKSQHCSFPNAGGITSSTISEFNWQANSFNVWVNRKDDEALNFDLTSPFFWPYLTDNISQFNNSALADKDFYEADGWEAVYAKIGTETAAVDNPGFVLYNRYEGILRVFIYMRARNQDVSNVPNGSFSTATINTKLKNDGGTVSKMTGLFSYIKGPVRALDKFDKEIEVTTPNEWHNPTNGQWLHVDIPMAYDPCTCNGNRLTNTSPNRYSILDIYPNLTSVSSIDLIYGKKANDKKKIVDNNTTLPAEFKAGINKLDAAQKAGNKTYKGVNDFLSFTKTIVKAFEPAPDTLGLGVLKPEFFKVNTSTAINLIDNFKKYGPEIGAVLSIIDFLIIGPKNASTTTSNTLYSASGNITEQYKFNGLTFFTPGSQYPAGTSVDLPIYKNILGVFGVLETPKIERAYDINIDWFASPVPYHRERVKLAEDIKYVVNPASNLELEQLRGALYFPMKIDNFDYIFSNNDYEVITNLVPAYTAYVNNKKVTYYRTPYMPVSCLKDFVVTLDINYVGHDITSNGGVPFGERTSAMYNPLLDVPTLQLTTKFSTKPTVQDYREVNLITKYETDVRTLDTITAIGGNSFSNVSVNQLVENLTLTQDETIMAWEHIVVGDNINTNGHKLTIISGGAIDLGDFEFNPDIEMKIDHPIACHRVVPQQTAAEVATFCQDNNKYKPNFDKSPEKEVLKHEKEGNFSMLAYPNPFETSTTVEFTLVEEENVTLRLFNALGVEVESIMEQETLSAGTYKRVTRSDLSSGIYFAVLQADNGTQTIKIIKQ